MKQEYATEDNELGYTPDLHKSGTIPRPKGLEFWLSIPRPKGVSVEEWDKIQQDKWDKIFKKENQ